MSGRVATLRAPYAQRPIRKSGRCSGEFFTRKGSSRSQTPLVILQPQFREKYLHNCSVRMVWPTVYDGQEVTIINMFYFYTNVHSYVNAIKNCYWLRIFRYSYCLCRYFTRISTLMLIWFSRRHYKLGNTIMVIEAINKSKLQLCVSYVN